MTNIVWSHLYLELKKKTTNAKKIHRKRDQTCGDQTEMEPVGRMNWMKMVQTFSYS